jgi:hypothetical protein
MGGERHNKKHLANNRTSFSDVSKTKGSEVNFHASVVGSVSQLLRLDVSRFYKTFQICPDLRIRLLFVRHTLTFFFLTRKNTNRRDDDAKKNVRSLSIISD